jgi:hypothetical protein
VGSWLDEDCEDKKLQQSDLRVSFALDVVVVAFMNTEGPFDYNNSFFLIY